MNNSELANYSTNRLFMNKIKLFAIILFSTLLGGQLQAQEVLQLGIDHYTVPTQDTVKVKISVINFSNIVSLAFSLNWDPEVISFIEEDEKYFDTIGTGQPEDDVINGRLRVSWFDFSDNGQTIDDGEAFISLNFLAIGDPGMMTDIQITNVPLQIEIVQSRDGGYHELEEDEMDLNTGSVTIEEEAEEISLTATTTDVVCDGDDNGAIDIVLQGNGNYTYNWSGPDGYMSTNPDIENLISGNYQLNVFDEDGLLVLDTSFVINEPLEAFLVSEIQADTTDCTDPNGSAIVTISGGTAPFDYDFGFGGTASNTVSDLAPGMYGVTVTDANNCVTESAFQIFSPNSPSVDLGEDMAICEGETVFLEAGDFQTYEWSTEESLADISVSTTGSYSVTVTDDNACTAVDTIFIDVQGLINLTVESDSMSICPGDSVQLSVIGGIEYEWLNEQRTLSQVNIANPLASPTENTVYTVISSNECSVDSAFVTVNLYEITATAGRDTCIAKGETLSLEASGGEIYYWIGSDKGYPLSNYNIPNPTTSPEDSTVYSILIIDENQCETVDSVVVLVGSDPLRFLTRVNMLTPNGDGKNDILDFGYIGKYGANTLRVFNRWGDIMYERVGYQTDENRFDGTYKGKILPSGTYYYVLSFRDGQSIKQTLTIVRD